MHAVGSGLVVRIKAFWPMLAGIVCARTALIVACYGSYSSTDDGLFTDGAMLVTCGLFAVFIALSFRSHRVLDDRAAQIIFVPSVAVAAACSVALATFDTADQSLLSLGFALSVASTIALSLCMFYWLRSLRPADEVTAALFVFAAFSVSVVLVYLLSFAPTRFQNIVGAILIVAQLALIGPAAAHEGQLASRPHRRARTFFTFARSHIQDTRFLIGCTIGVGCLGFVDGFLRGYPDGLPIPFTPGTRLAYVALSLGVCLLLMIFIVRRRERVMTVGVFVTMELLASAALVLFGAFPFQWEIGAAVVNTLNLVICAYCWYVVIAFTHFGQRDPYLYAMGGWVVCFGSRSIARMLLLFVYPLTGNDLFINAVLGALILISAQVVLIQFLLAEHREWSTESERRDAEAEEALRLAAADVAGTEAALAQAEQALRAVTRDAAEHEAAEVAAAVAAVQRAAFEAISAAQAERCIKCTDGCSPAFQAPQGNAVAIARGGALAPATGAADAAGAAGEGATRRASGGTPVAGHDGSDTLPARVRAMSEQFLLSDREMDVLALYARGHTQKKVAEELNITPATAHTHIKRIYSKCGMHSRQEILEYLSSYGA